MSYKEIEYFVTDGKFVNPEKVTAIDMYGLMTHATKVSEFVSGRIPSGTILTWNTWESR